MHANSDLSDQGLQPARNNEETKQKATITPGNKVMRQMPRLKTNSKTVKKFCARVMQVFYIASKQF